MIRYVCPQCGAVYEVKEDDLVVRCQYCSTVFRTFAEEQRYLLPAYYDSSSAIEHFLLWVKKQLGYDESLPLHIELKGAELHFYPFWVVSLSIKTSFSGLGEDAEYHGGGGGVYRSVRTIYKEESGSFERFFEYSVPASNEIPAAEKGYRVSARGRKFYSSSYIEQVGGVLHGATLDRKDAVDRAVESAKNIMTGLVEREVVRVEERSDEVDVSQVVFVNVPVWRVSYRFKGRDYLTMIDASSCRTIQATYPPDIVEKVSYVGLGLGHAVAAFVLAGLLSTLGFMPALTAFIGFAATGAGYISRGLRPARAGEEVE